MTGLPASIAARSTVAVYSWVLIGRDGWLCSGTGPQEAPGMDALNDMSSSPGKLRAWLLSSRQSKD